MQDMDNFEEFIRLFVERFNTQIQYSNQKLTCQLA